MRGAVARARRIAQSANAQSERRRGACQRERQTRRCGVGGPTVRDSGKPSLEFASPWYLQQKPDRPKSIRGQQLFIVFDIVGPAYAAGGSMSEQADGGWGRARESRAGPCQRTARSSGRRGKTGSSCTSRLHAAPLQAAQLAAAMSHVARLMLDRVRPPGSVAQSSVDMPQTSSDAGGLHAWQTTRSDRGTPRCRGMRPHMSQQRTSAPVSACHPNQSR